MKAALTAEEWKHALGVLSAGAPPSIAAVVCIERVGIDDAHSLAALCLHAQPFGFTWEDVKMLRECADNARNNTNFDGIEEADHTDAVADRISVLLPPEGAA